MTRELVFIARARASQSTSTLPPTRLPAITGTKLRASPRSSTGSPATECSKPAATKAEIGSTIAAALSTTLRPAKLIHTAMQTSTLHITSLKNALTQGKEVFAAAILPQR